MSEQARAYQAQVTGAPKRWSYKVCREGECAHYDGYDPKTGTLLEAKAREYEKWFDENLRPRWNYEGLGGMLEQAERQLGSRGNFGCVGTSRKSAWSWCSGNISTPWVSSPWKSSTHRHCHEARRA
ncbi:Tox-REase-5 domain-containing protein [Melittangium boletus]|uniref:Tox-REase-5 domain-containing protein n=1 Tax=Melittangium boletus TaxID=83453 RepID=UPI003DA4DD94